MVRPLSGKRLLLVVDDANLAELVAEAARRRGDRRDAERRRPGHRPLPSLPRAAGEVLRLGAADFFEEPFPVLAGTARIGFR